MPSRYYAGTFSLEGLQLQIPTARGVAPLVVRLTRDVPYRATSIRSVTLLADGPRLCVDVIAEIEVERYEPGRAPDPDRIAGVDLGIIHPFAVEADEGSLLVPGRAQRAEARLHLAASKARRRAMARRVSGKGQRGSRRWRKYRNWRVGQLIAVLQDKAKAAGIEVITVDDVDPDRLAITHRRAGRHLPGRTRRDPRRVAPEQRGRLGGLGPAVARPGDVENDGSGESLAQDASAS